MEYVRLIMALCGGVPLGPAITYPFQAHDEAVRHASAQHTMCQLLTGAPYSSGRVLVRRHESRVS